MKFVKALAVTLTISLLFSFMSFAAREGMSVIEGNSKRTIYKYVTGVENEYGYSDYLKNEWKQVWDNWYYFGEDGVSMQNTWAEIDGKWYYFDQWSVMQHDTTIDGHLLGSDGAWISADGETAPVQGTATNN